jgi:hypothetical protein
VTIRLLSCRCEKPAFTFPARQPTAR